MSKQKKSNCNCKAYTFPHRIFSGNCLANEQGPFCGHCGMSCEVNVVNDGIGQYEFWGQVGYDLETVAYSKCCDYVVYDEPGLGVK